MPTNRSQMISGAGGIASQEQFGSPRVQMSSNLWVQWTDIPIEHARAANDARKRAIEAETGSREMSKAFADEIRAGLVAVTGAAFAIDAWMIAVEDMVRLPTHVLTAWRREGARPARAARVMETLRAGFDLRGVDARWGGDLKRLFRLRKDAVHFKSELYDSQPHPTGKSNVSTEHVIYSAETAVWAADLTVEVITHCINSPRPNTSLVKWCGGLAHMPAFLAETRQRELGP